MKFISKFVIAIVFFAAAPSVSMAVTPLTPKLSLEQGYVFAPLAGSNATAGYGTLVNISKETVEILGLKSVSFKAAEMHETKEENGLMKMKKLAKLTLKAGEKFELKPGGNHLMLFDATSTLKVGDTVSLIFEIADSKGKPTVMSVVDAPVKPRVTGPSEAPAHDHSHHH